MRITEILIESELQEGPLLNKIGTGLGKVAGGAAKAVGAVAGGIAGIGSAVKKGFAAGKSTVAAGSDAPAASSTAPAAKPAANVAPPTGTPATASTPTSGAVSATAQAKPGTKVASGAPVAPNPKAASAYSAAQKAAQSLAPQQKKELITLLQADPKVKAATTAKPAAGAMGAMAQQLGGKKPANTMANAPVSKTNVAKPGNPNVAPTGNYDPNTGQPISDKGKADSADKAAYKASPKGKEVAAWNDAIDAAEAAGQTPPTLAQFRSSQTAPAGEVPAKKTKVASRVPKKAAPSQAELDADREARMGNFSDSRIRTGKMMAEGFSLFRK